MGDDLLWWWKPMASKNGPSWTHSTDGLFDRGAVKNNTIPSLELKALFLAFCYSKTGVACLKYGDFMFPFYMVSIMYQVIQIGTWNIIKGKKLGF